MENFTVNYNGSDDTARPAYTPLADLGQHVAFITCPSGLLIAYPDDNPKAAHYDAEDYKVTVWVAEKRRTGTLDTESIPSTNLRGLLA
jgi:hypothetical protein